jgi:hypothetical protein
MNEFKSGQDGIASGVVNGDVNHNGFIKINMKHLPTWDINKTIDWLTNIGFEDCVPYFKEHRINGRALLMLNEDDMKEVIRHNVGQRKNLYHLVRRLQLRFTHFIESSMNDPIDSDTETDNNRDLYDVDTDDSDTQIDFNFKSNLLDKTLKSYLKSKLNDSSGLIEDDSTSITNSHSLINNDNIVNSNDTSDSSNLNSTINTSSLKSKLIIEDDALLNNRSSHNHHHHHHHHNNEKSLNFCENCLKRFDSSPYSSYTKQSNNELSPIRNYKGERTKTLISMFYLFIISLWTAFSKLTLT